MPSTTPQPIVATPTRAAIFLIVTVNPGPGHEEAVRSLSVDLAGLLRAVGFRDHNGRLSCVTAFGADAWDRLIGVPKPRELHPFREIRGRHRAVATPCDIVFHIRATRLDLCFEPATQIMSRPGRAISTADEVHGFNCFDDRELAAISEASSAQIGEEASRTLKRHLAARRGVDVQGPKGPELSSLGTGHLRQIQAPDDGIQSALREAKALVQSRIPLELTRQAIDDVERGATDSDWAPLKEAARKIAFAEDRSVFDGYEAAGIEGIGQGASNPLVTLPQNVEGYPAAIAQAVSQLCLAGLNGPYALVPGAKQYTDIGGGSDEGYTVLRHVQRLVDGEIVWAPSIDGGLVLTTRGADAGSVAREGGASSRLNRT